MKNGDDQGKLRQLDEIIYLHNYPEYHHIANIEEKSMEVVCDCKEIGSTKFFRVNDSNVLAWMYSKKQQELLSIMSAKAIMQEENVTRDLNSSMDSASESLDEKPLNLLHKDRKLFYPSKTRMARSSFVSTRAR